MGVLSNVYPAFSQMFLWLVPKTTWFGAFPDLKSEPLLEDFIPLASGVPVYSEVEQICCDISAVSTHPIQSSVRRCRTMLYPPSHSHSIAETLPSQPICARHPAEINQCNTKLIFMPYLAWHSALMCGVSTHGTQSGSTIIPVLILAYIFISPFIHTHIPTYIHGGGGVAQLVKALGW